MCWGYVADHVPNDVRNTERHMSSVPSVERAALVLEVLAESGAPVSFAHIVKRAGLPKSSAHDICSALVRTRLIDKDGNGNYRLGLRLINIARHELSNNDVVEHFLRICHEEDPVRSETIVLSVLDGTEVIYLACRRGDKPLAVQYRLGMKLPALTTASGKVLLTYLPQERIDELFPRDDSSDGSPLEDDLLKRFLDTRATVRETGFSIDDEETAPGMLCVGAPLFSSGATEPVAAIAISLVKATVDDKVRASITDELQSLASSISQSLGYIGADVVTRSVR